MRHPDGAAPRFGSCYFVLAPDVSARATFTYLDSHQDPIQKGTLEELDDVLAALFNEAFTRDFAIGERNLRPAGLLAHLLERLPEPYEAPATRTPGRNLDHYIEAQVHGDVRLEEDVQTLVADPSFRDTATGHALQRLCERYAIECTWHMGFQLAPGAVPDDFRGPTMPPLAAHFARAGWLHAAAVGEAASTLKRSPTTSPATPGIAPLQQLTWLWHVLVRFGEPNSRPAAQFAHP